MIDYGQALADDLVGVGSISNDAPAVFSLGLTTITWTAADTSGNTVVGTQRVNVVDTTPPTLYVTQEIVFEGTSLDANVINVGQATATDLIRVDSITNDAPIVFPVGETMVTWLAIDSSANNVTKTQKVSVVDTTPPTIAAPNDITVEATSLTDNVVELGIAQGEDLISEVTITNNAPKTFPFGETLVTWTATDSSGNVASSTQQVNVIDTTPPNLVVPEDIVVDADDLENFVSIGQATASDITDDSPAITNDAPQLYPLGETIVTWTATDHLGNTISVSQTVNVQACGRLASYYNLIMGSTDDDIILGTNLPDLIFGLGGDDIVFGLKGNDCILGGEGDDIIFGNEGNDFLIGGEGNDILKAQSGQDNILGGKGTDIIDGGDDFDQCNGSESSSSDIVVKCEG